MITDHSIAAALRLEPYPAPWEKPLSLELALTECYRAHRDAPAAQREAACLRIQLPAMMQPMQPGDTFAGRIRYPLVGLSPEPMGLGWYCLADPIRKILDAAEHAPEHTPGHAAEHAAEHVPGHASEHASEHATEHPPEHVPGHTSEHTSEHAPEHAPEHAATEHATTFALTAADRARIETMLAFWKTETTHAKVRAAYPDDVRRILPEDDWPNHPGAAFPLYRMAGITLDNEKLLRLGLPGLAALLTLTTPPPTSPSPSARACPLYSSAFATFDKSALAILETLSGICRHYAAQARALNQPETAAALEAITTRAPQTMREAIQLFWLVTLASGVCNYGRMDVWLGPFLARDLAAGTLTRASALALLQALWRHIATAYDNMFNNRIVIGGLGRPDEAAADQFALLAIEATRTVTLNQPQLTLRFHAAQNPALMQAALASIGEGRTFPMLYNDDVNIPAVASA
ncbi:MAG: pyruvate formate lyase family protein, partial [Opitutaceae bacterium]|nr:pyruvate formate lyase family protein [Opitutaceae bacterium]